MRNLKIFFIALFGLSLISCAKKDEIDCYNWHPYDIMQRVKLVDENGEWINGIKNAKLELIAYDRNWEKPRFDKKKENG